MRIIISDVNADHANTVKAAILSAYSSLTETDIEIRVESLSISLIYASANGAEMVVRSTTGIASNELTALDYYPDIQVVMPLGSNTYEELMALSEIINIIATGAGDTQNRTGYGNALEFWDDDNGAEGDLSSFSNGVIAGKLLAIKDYHNTNWYGARSIARQSTGSNWDKYNGYGKIDLTTAYAITPETEAYYEENDPFIPHASTPVIGTVQRLGEESIQISYSGTTRRDSTILYKDGVQIATAAMGNLFTVDNIRSYQRQVFQLKNSYTNAYGTTEEALSQVYSFSSIACENLWFVQN